MDDATTIFVPVNDVSQQQQCGDLGGIMEEWPRPLVNDPKLGIMMERKGEVRFWFGDEETAPPLIVLHILCCSAVRKYASPSPPTFTTQFSNTCLPPGPSTYVQVIRITHLTIIMTFLECKRNRISRSLTISTTIPHSPGTCLHENVSLCSHGQLMIGYIETGPGLLVMCSNVWRTLEIITPGSITIRTEIEGPQRFHNHNLLVKSLLGILAHSKIYSWLLK